jgi:hypothetical protein
MVGCLMFLSSLRVRVERKVVPVEVETHLDSPA